MNKLREIRDWWQAKGLGIIGLVIIIGLGFAVHPIVGCILCFMAWTGLKKNGLPEVPHRTDPDSWRTPPPNYSPDNIDWAKRIKEIEAEFKAVENSWESLRSEEKADQFRKLHPSKPPRLLKPGETLTNRELYDSGVMIDPPRECSQEERQIWWNSPSGRKWPGY
jgi:hypothetical protein